MDSFKEFTHIDSDRRGKRVPFIHFRLLLAFMCFPCFSSHIESSSFQSDYFTGIEFIYFHGNGFARLSQEKLRGLSPNIPNSYFTPWPPRTCPSIAWIVCVFFMTMAEQRHQSSVASELWPLCFLQSKLNTVYK